MQQEVSTSTAMAGGLSSDSMESIAERLSQIENLYFPRALQPSATTPSHRKPLLLELMSRDIPLFLERYGSQLTLEELKVFDALKNDYEINWHLNHLRSVINPTEEELKSRSAKIRNRRRAYMDKLISGGQYFSEDAMREREPYLHHEYLGKFQDPSGRSMARPGERWSETLMRRSEEARLVERIRDEQQRRGVAQSDWVGFGREQEEEEEEEEEETEEEEEEEESAWGREEKANEGRQEEKEEFEMEEIENHLNNGSADQPEVDANRRDTCENEQSTAPRPAEEVSLSTEEMEDRMDQFTYIMQQKFLSGEDNMDYSKIDEDETLDDHWMREANHDAEEKYFDDV